MMKKVVIFGLGLGYYMGYSQLNEEYEILALTDNSEEVREWATNISLHRGVKVISPSEILNLNIDLVLITVTNPTFIEEIKVQLQNMGVEEEQIGVFKERGVTPFLIDPMFYEMDLSYDQKKKLFADNVEHVTIEPNSRCNRKCWFCPNSVIDRNSNNIPMKKEIFEKIIYELKEIDYNGMVSYSFYNEPLLDEGLEEKIAFVKEHLPKCMQLVSTNGDYLTPERLQSLIDAGLDDMVISVYNENNPNFEWTKEKAEEQIWYFINKLQLDMICIFSDEKTVTGFGKKHGLNVRLQNHDLRSAAHNRGEILSDSLPIVQKTTRTTFCMNSFVTLNIYYDGSVYTCGNRRNDWKAHDEFLMGNVADDTIFNIFQSEQAQKFRKNFTQDPNQYPCRSCTMEADTFIYQSPTIPVRDRPRYTRNKKC